ncbi:MAG: hypothetical protein OJI67_11755, partial [Prosthecobacter sp.]|nr:hypothetical protein [Prosthecobacter sp.]
MKRSRHWQWFHKALVSAAALTVPFSFGETSWNQGNAGNHDWQLDTNWLPNTVPNSFAEVVNFGFTPPGVQTISLNGIVTLGTLNFNNSHGGSFVLAPGTGGSLVFNTGSNASTILNAGNGSNLISAPISLEEDLTAQVNAGTLVLSGIVSGSGFGLVKNGNGLLVLSGVNTFTGISTLNGGITLLTASAGLGTSAGGGIINDGATLALGPINAGGGGIS